MSDVGKGCRPEGQYGRPDIDVGNDLDSKYVCEARATIGPERTEDEVFAFLVEDKNAGEHYCGRERGWEPVREMFRSLLFFVGRECRIPMAVLGADVALRGCETRIQAWQLRWRDRGVVSSDMELIKSSIDYQSAWIFGRPRNQLVAVLFSALS